MESAPPHVAIVGGGPTGLEAALACVDTGRSFTLYEVASDVAANVRAWGHVALFTPWDMIVSPRMARHLAAAGVEVPSGEGLPTGADVVERLLEPVAALPSVAPHLRLGTRVMSIGRQGLRKHEEIATPERGSRPFRLLLDAAGGEDVGRSDVVLDCTGTYHNPNALGDGGIPAPGEQALEADIVRHIPDFEVEADQWAGRRVLLAGAGASAQTAARALASLVGDAGGDVVWAVREPSPTWGAVAYDPLPARASLVAEAERLAAGHHPGVRVRTGVEVERLERRDEGIGVTLRNGSGPEEVVVDKVLALTGYVGDHELYRQLQVHECYATAAPIDLSAALLGSAAGDCLTQVSHGPDVLRNPEPNFFIVGMKSYGRVNQYLMRIGWEQVSDVFTLLDQAATPSTAG